jgi:2,3-bisphosphoglycerate-dependent phosphoglycerate mutase
VFRYGFTSFLKRAIKTLDIALEEMNLLWIPVEKTWRLNEKHYGSLQGLNKQEMVEKYGEEQVLIWRRSYNVRPPALDLSDKQHPANDIRYQHQGDLAATPSTEALADTVGRIVPYWQNTIKPKLLEEKEVIIAAHGNSLRSIVKYLKNINDEDILHLNLPTGIPYVFEFDENVNLLKDYFLAEEETLRKLMDEVANQGKKKI